MLSSKPDASCTYGGLEAAGMQEAIQLYSLLRVAVNIASWGSCFHAPYCRLRTSKDHMLQDFLGGLSGKSKNHYGRLCCGIQSLCHGTGEVQKHPGSQQQRHGQPQQVGKGPALNSREEARWKANENKIPAKENMDYIK